MSLLKLINTRGLFVPRPLWLMYSSNWIQSGFITGIRPLNHHYNSVVKGFGCSYVNYSYPFQNNNITRDSIEEQIKYVEVEIKSVQLEIAKVEKKIEESEGTEKKYYMEEKKQLRDEKNKLLDKEKQIRDEKNLLLQKQQPVEQSMNEFGSICSFFAVLLSYVLLIQ